MEVNHNGDNDNNDDDDEDDDDEKSCTSPFADFNRSLLIRRDTKPNKFLLHPVFS